MGYLEGTRTHLSPRPHCLCMNPRLNKRPSDSPRAPLSSFPGAIGEPVEMDVAPLYEPQRKGDIVDAIANYSGGGGHATLGECITA